MAVVEVFIMATLTCEEVIPTCTSATGPGSCGLGMFCDVAQDPDVLVTGQCVDCEFWRAAGTDNYGNVLGEVVNASAAHVCANDLPGLCDKVASGRPITYSTYITGERVRVLTAV